MFWTLRTKLIQLYFNYQQNMNGRKFNLVLSGYHPCQIIWVLEQSQSDGAAFVTSFMIEIFEKFYQGMRKILKWRDVKQGRLNIKDDWTPLLCKCKNQLKLVFHITFTKIIPFTYISRPIWVITGTFTWTISRKKGICLSFFEKGKKYSKKGQRGRKNNL